jgi:hypothetical protein
MGLLGFNILGVAPGKKAYAFMPVDGLCLKLFILGQFKLSYSALGDII